jgi:hypothetical protein
MVSVFIFRVCELRLDKHKMKKPELTGIPEQHGES